jgi:hypothetical protein
LLAKSRGLESAKRIELEKTRLFDSSLQAWNSHSHFRDKNKATAKTAAALSFNPKYSISE